ncbi:MAG: flagellar hook-basal body complex protein, partial [Mesorhizobium sp.]
MKALAIAATGMNAQQTNLEVIANNIANINTTGYKRARAEFSDLLYQVDRTQGVPNRSNTSLVPEGVSIGLGVKTTAVRNVHTQGELASTGNSFDLALTGRGWFQIEGADGGTLYSRAGAFNTNATGQLVTVDGASVIPAITVPTDAIEVIVNKT